MAALTAYAFYFYDEDEQRSEGPILLIMAYGNEEARNSLRNKLISESTIPNSIHYCNIYLGNIKQITSNDGSGFETSQGIYQCQTNYLPGNETFEFFTKKISVEEPIHMPIRE